MIDRDGLKQGLKSTGNRTAGEDNRWDKRLSGWAAQTGILALAEALNARQENALRILAYHRIGYPEQVQEWYDPALISATPEGFAEQMNYLVENYHVISLEEVIEAILYKRPLPSRSVLITFDDGYRDFLETAWPILRMHKLPSVLFVATGYLDGAGKLYWWDLLYRAIFQTRKATFLLPLYGEWHLGTKVQREEAYAQLKKIIERTEHVQTMKLVDEVLNQLDYVPTPDKALLTWDEIRFLQAHDVSIGAHTQTHPILSRLPLHEAEKEVAGSQEELRLRLGKTLPVFAFPMGHPKHLRPDLLAFLQESGFLLAVTMIEGHNQLGKTHPLQLKRLGMAPHLSISDFRLALTSIYDIYGSLMRFRQGFAEHSAVSVT